MKEKSKQCKILLAIIIFTTVKISENMNDLFPLCHNHSNDCSFPREEKFPGLPLYC